jgi:hypothetical protein
MDVAYALAESVRDWTQRRCPDDPRVAQPAVSVALNSYADGASVAEACERARAFVASWTLHPGHIGDRQTGTVPLAS